MESDLVPSRRKLLADIEINFGKLKKNGISSLTDLRSSIRNPKNIAAFSAKTYIEMEYLTLLRREVESYFPKAYTLRAFDWLDKTQIGMLEETGHTNTALLYEAFEESAKHKVPIVSAGLDDEFAVEICALVDLVRIQWVSPMFSRVLVAAGYKSAKSVAGANTEALYEAVEKANKDDRYFKGKIGIRDIERLIKSASYLS